MPNLNATSLDPKSPFYIAPGAFSAVFRVPYPDGTQTITCCSQVGALKVALHLALSELPADEVAQLLAVETAAMLRSLQHPRRLQNEEVLLAVRAGYGGEPGRYRLTGKNDFGCPLCGNPSCREWDTIEQIDDTGLCTGDEAYHVCECQMEDAGKSRLP